MYQGMQLGVGGTATASCRPELAVQAAPDLRADGLRELDRHGVPDLVVLAGLVAVEYEPVGKPWSLAASRMVIVRSCSGWVYSPDLGSRKRVITARGIPSQVIRRYRRVWSLRSARCMPSRAAAPAAGRASPGRA